VSAGYDAHCDLARDADDVAPGLPLGIDVGAGVSPEVAAGVVLGPGRRLPSTRLTTWTTEKMLMAATTTPTSVGSACAYPHQDASVAVLDQSTG
jgi:hypothetical protein